MRAPPALLPKIPHAPALPEALPKPLPTAVRLPPLVLLFASSAQHHFLFISTPQPTRPGRGETLCTSLESPRAKTSLLCGYHPGLAAWPPARGALRDRLAAAAGRSRCCKSSTRQNHELWGGTGCPAGAVPTAARQKWSEREVRAAGAAGAGQGMPSGGSLSSPGHPCCRGMLHPNFPPAAGCFPERDLALLGHTVVGKGPSARAWRGRAGAVPVQGCWRKQPTHVTGLQPCAASTADTLLGAARPAARAAPPSSSARAGNGSGRPHRGEQRGGGGSAPGAWPHCSLWSPCLHPHKLGGGLSIPNPLLLPAAPWGRDAAALLLLLLPVGWGQMGALGCSRAPRGHSRVWGKAAASKDRASKAAVASVAGPGCWHCHPPAPRGSAPRPPQPPRPHLPILPAPHPAGGEGGHFGGRVRRLLRCALTFLWHGSLSLALEGLRRSMVLGPPRGAVRGAGPSAWRGTYRGAGTEAGKHTGSQQSHERCSQRRSSGLARWARRKEDLLEASALPRAPRRGASIAPRCPPPVLLMGSVSPPGRRGGSPAHLLRPLPVPLHPPSWDIGLGCPLHPQVVPALQKGSWPQVGRAHERLTPPVGVDTV